VIDYYRSSNRINPIPLDNALQLSDLTQCPEDRFFEDEVKAELLKALAKLNQRERTIIALKFWSDCSNKEIARQIEVSDSNVAVILYRAMRKLRNILDDSNFDYAS